MTREKALALRALIERATASLDDGAALAGVELFPAWQADRSYAVDDRVRFAGKLYRCVQAHTSQAAWSPELTPALWTALAAPGEIPVWRQPSGAQDAYNKGDRVRWPDENGAVYESLIDANVYSPEAYPAGWKRIG